MRPSNLSTVVYPLFLHVCTLILFFGQNKKICICLFLNLCLLFSTQCDSTAMCFLKIVHIQTLQLTNDFLLSMHRRLHVPPSFNFTPYSDSKVELRVLAVRLLKTSNSIY